MSASTVHVAPSILSADFARLADEVAAVEAAGADWLHVDVMDGHFVPNLTVGPPIVAALHQTTTLPLDVHLMMTNPDAYIADFAQAGASYLTVHVETCPHLHRTLQHIKAQGVKAGVALNPSTSLATLEDVIADLDLLLIMSVNPGFGGQTFIPACLGKIARARQCLERTGSHALLEVDGGLKADNVAGVLQAGANVLVAGSAIFHAPACPWRPGRPGGAPSDRGNSPRYADAIAAFRDAAATRSPRPHGSAPSPGGKGLG